MSKKIDFIDIQKLYKLFKSSIKKFELRLVMGAAGAIESVAGVLGLYHGFIFPSINCEDIHPDIASIIGEEKIPQQLIKTDTLQVIAKASFGFGDINSCIIFKKYNG